MPRMPRPALLAALLAVPLGGLLLRDGTEPARPVAPPLAITGVTLHDGTGAPPRPGTTIVVRDGRVAEVFGDGARPIPADATVEGFAGHHVIPGLVDAHVHLGTQPRPPAVMDGLLRATLLGGVTTVRDMGGGAGVVPDVARRAATDTVAWPRVYTSAVMTGPGSRWFEGEWGGRQHGPHAPGTAPTVRRVDDVADVRQAIADARAAGVTGIKLYGDLPAPLVRALADAARARGLRVWSHLAVGPASPGEVVDAGAHVVSHADQFLAAAIPPAPAGETPNARRARIAAARRAVPPDTAPILAVLARMRERGTMLDPTLFVMTPLEGDPAVDDGPWLAVRFATATTRLAHRMGIPIVAGTDALGGSTPNLHAELQLLVGAVGLTPVEAIVAATSNAARAIGADSLGTVAPGMVADLVVLRADPARDVRNTQTVVAVVKGGRLLRRTTPWRTGPGARAPGAR